MTGAVCALVFTGFNFATTAAGFATAAFLAGIATGFALAAGVPAAVAGAAFGLFFGRPPLRANCASANILANASLASVMS